jgi:hypothetical protein
MAESCRPSWPAVGGTAAQALSTAVCLITLVGSARNPADAWAWDIAGLAFALGVAQMQACGRLLAAFRLVALVAITAALATGRDYGLAGLAASLIIPDDATAAAPAIVTPWPSLAGGLALASLGIPGGIPMAGPVLVGLAALSSVVCAYKQTSAVVPVAAWPCTFSGARFAASTILSAVAIASAYETSKQSAVVLVIVLPVLVVELGLVRRPPTKVGPMSCWTTLVLFFVVVVQEVASSTDDTTAVAATLVSAGVWMLDRAFSETAGSAVSIRRQATSDLKSKNLCARVLARVEVRLIWMSVLAWAFAAGCSVAVDHARPYVSSALYAVVGIGAV